MCYKAELRKYKRILTFSKRILLDFPNSAFALFAHKCASLRTNHSRIKKPTTTGGRKNRRFYNSLCFLYPSDGKQGLPTPISQENLQGVPDNFFFGFMFKCTFSFVFQMRSIAHKSLQYKKRQFYRGVKKSAMI